MGFPLHVLWRLLALATVLLPALAQADPPARVGRLSLVEGSVLFRADRADAGRPASVNWPVIAGAIFDTDPGARTEIWLGSTAFRLGGASRLEFATVDDDRLTLNLAAGTLAVTLRDQDQADALEIRTPEGRVQFGRAGRYRVDLAPGRTTVTSRAGSAYVYSEGPPRPVPEGRSLVLMANGATTLYGELPADALDAWAASRDAAGAATTARRYVSPEMTGYEDLDRYGDWNSGTEYGVIWYPRQVPTGWAPYRYGHWAWIEPWGWTWIDDAPWGFAPFHYGRWVIIGGRWAWVPGSRGVRPVFAPALVMWFGSDGWAISGHSGPAVGWFPLGPGEVFVPPYRCTTPYLNRLNMPHVPDHRRIDKALADMGNRRFLHQTIPQSVTVVPLRSVREGRPVGGTLLRPDTGDVGRQPVMVRPPSYSGALFRSGPEAHEVAPAPNKADLDLARPEPRPPTPRSSSSVEVPTGRWTQPSVPARVPEPPASRFPDAGGDRVPQPLPRPQLVPSSPEAARPMPRPQDVSPRPQEASPRPQWRTDGRSASELVPGRGAFSSPDVPRARESAGSDAAMKGPSMDRDAAAKGQAMGVPSGRGTMPQMRPFPQ